jgi:hypothetical protein
MKLAAILAWAALFSWSNLVQASPLKGAKRIVNSQTVDLAPLFHWWTNHNGDRPLTAWVHVTGSIVGTNGLNWIVRANTESSGRDEKQGASSAGAGGEKRILLRTPPNWDRAEFERLLAQLRPLKEQRARIASVEKQAKGQSKQGSNPSYRSARSRARAEAKSLQAQETLHEAKTEMGDLDKQIKALETKLAGYPSADHYLVDCFALDTGKDQGGVPLYEHGTGWQ